MWVPALVLIGATAGTLMLLHHGVWGLSLDTKIRPAEVATVAVNLFIAIFLQYFLAGRARDSRAEKDILIENTSAVIKQLRTSREVISSYQPSPDARDSGREVLLALRSLANELLYMQQVLSASTHKDLIDQFTELQQTYYFFKRASTGGNFPKPYTSSQLRDQEKAFRKLHNELHCLVFDINRHQ
jgi:hypothetical protein